MPKMTPSIKQSAHNTTTVNPENKGDDTVNISSATLKRMRKHTERVDKENKALRLRVVELQTQLSLR